MGNRRNRVLRRKKLPPHLLKKSQHKIDYRTTETNNVTVDIVSVLCPTSAIKLECDEAVDPISIAATSENCIENIKNKISYYDSSTNEYPHVDSIEIKTELPYPSTNEYLHVESIDMKIELPETNKYLEDRKHKLIDAFKNKCRLCLTEDDGTWSNVFSSEPYEDCDEITPSNILAVIEQFTTVKISKHDRLPDKLCAACLRSLRFMCEFRKTSLRAKETLDLALSKHDEQRKALMKITRSERMLQLTSHLASNRDEFKKITGEVQCDTCGKVFERPIKLQYHLNRHSGIQPFVCEEPYCDKSFYSPMSLKSHVRTVHSKEPRFECDVGNCKRVFNEAQKFRNHRTTHFPPTIPCTICGKLLRNQTSVTKHMASHSERRFKCDDCGKSFQTAYTLRIHRRTHTNEKPYICCKCAEPFAYNCLLKAHTEKYHPS